MDINIIATSKGLAGAKTSWYIAFFKSSPSNYFPINYSLLSKGYRLVHFLPSLCVMENQDKKQK